MTQCTDTPGSHASASTSVVLEILGNRTAATRSHCEPSGGRGLPTGASGTVPSESSASIHNPSANGTTPYVGRPVNVRNWSSPGANRAGSPRNLLITNPATRA